MPQAVKICRVITPTFSQDGGSGGGVRNKRGVSFSSIVNLPICNPVTCEPKLVPNTALVLNLLVRLAFQARARFSCARCNRPGGCWW